MPTTLPEIDLSPIPGKTYFNCNREWCEEFIYFVMVDRFDDHTGRAPALGPARSLGTTVLPARFYGGKIAGITRNLDYIANLGCTAIWLSPVLEAHSYHGYDTSSYLDINPNFGTEADLITLVNAAHSYQKAGQPYPIKVILDVVINHSGDNWAYPGDYPYYYSGGQQFDFGFWRQANRPVPLELQNPDYYHRCGQIGPNDYDTSPENQLGDLFTLKDYHNDDDVTGSAVINTLIKSYCYWIREADVDGFRMDAVKHMSPLACSRFASNIREYAESLGKKDFFLYGELATPSDDAINSYIGPNTSVQSGPDTVYFGLDSVLDFRLAEGASGLPGLRDVIKGFADPNTLFQRLDALENRALNRGQIGRYLVTFVDNHDSFWQPQGRFGNGAPDAQIVGAIGFLLCNLGTACIYYGTEQGFQGSGGDEQMREAMFDTTVPGLNKLNGSCSIYQEIAKIAEVMRATPPLRFGRMYYRQISGDGVHFGLPFGNAYTLAFSRMLYSSEVLVAYNISGVARNDYIVVDSILSPPGSSKTFLYGGAGSVPVNYAPDGTAYVQLALGANQFVVLK
jgi:glycosidase